MMGDCHVRFLGEGKEAIPEPYPTAGLFIPLNFRSSSIRFLGESHLPRELVPITGFLRFLDPVEVYSFRNS